MMPYMGCVAGAFTADRRIPCICCERGGAVMLEGLHSVCTCRIRPLLVKTALVTCLSHTSLSVLRNT